MSILTSRCLCEKVIYEIRGKLGPIYNCHCSKCRRWHSAAFRTRASIKKNQIKWISGEDNLSCFKSSKNVTKHFCMTCGSPSISTYKDAPDVLGVPLGGLEGKFSGRPNAHIFTAFKADWYEITDSIPQYEGWPGGENNVRKTGEE